MPLSSDLISQFVKTTTDRVKTKNEATMYGRSVIYNDSLYVQLDGSDLLTPVTTTVDTNDGERVAVLIKDHSAVITGNLSSPAARTDAVKEVGEQVKVIFENLQEGSSDGGRTATNYIQASSLGLCVGDMTNDILGKNILITTETMDIRNSDTVLASYGDDTIYLGKNSQESVIDLCNGAARLYKEDLAPLGIEGGRFVIETEECIYLTTPHYIGMSTYWDDGTSRSGRSDFYMQANGYYSSDSNPFGSMSMNTYTVQTNGNLETLLSLSGDTISMFGNSTVSGYQALITLTASTGEVNIDASVGVNIKSPLYVTDNIYIEKSNFVLYAHDSSGSDTAILSLNNNNNCVVGYGCYTAGIGNTHIYGEDIRLYSKMGNSNVIPYFRTGMTETIRIKTAGYITNSGKDVYFSIPLAKPVIGSPTVTITSVNGFILRQDTNYTHGSNGVTSAIAYAKPTSYTATLYDNNYIDVKASFTTTTNALNNSTIGIDASIKITFA